MRKKVHDRYFVPYKSEQDIQKSIQAVAQRITLDLKDKNPIFLGVLNGSFMFAADLLRLLDFDLRISFVKLASYAGTESSGITTELIGINEDLKGQTIVIVEDIVDTGNTLEKLIKMLKAQEVADLHVATLLYKPKAYKKEFPIDYVAIEIPNDFVIGYGLDYDGLGRNLPNIYKIDNP